MNKEITVFAETTYRNSLRKFGIKQDDRRRHMYIIGKTGVGKSTVLENMIVDDIRAGNGVAVVDPHGDLAEKVIQFIPSERINDVVYFNPADYEYPIAFNILEQVEPHLRHLVASGLIGVFQKLWADSWGPRLEYILRNALLATLDYPGSTLLSVIRMLSDKKFRKKVVDNVEDPVVRAFWVNEFAGYADKFASEAVSPIQNKVGQFLSTALIRNIVGQVKSTINMREIMDSRKILIVNLSKGRIGEDSSQLLGNMIITKIQLAAMSRVDIPESEREDFYLYIDEFQNFTTDSFANILSEARKYKLNLIMAHQYIEQLGDVVRNAVFGNVGTMVVFRVGAADAEALVPEFTPTFTEEDIVNQPKYEFYLKLMIDGIASEPFSARGLHPLTKDEETGNVEKVITVSRERYAKDKASVEEKIAKWHNDEEETAQAMIQKKENARAKKSQNFQNQKTFQNPDQPSIAQQKLSPTQNTEVYKNETNCSMCGTITRTSFVPDGIRPVYCKDCLNKLKDEKNKEAEQRRIAKEEELRRIKEKNSLSPQKIKQNSAFKPEAQAQAPKNEPELSLSEALNIGAVNFKGKKIDSETEKKAKAKENESVDIKPPVFKPSNKKNTSNEKEFELKDGGIIKL